MKSATLFVLLATGGLACDQGRINVRSGHEIAVEASSLSLEAFRPEALKMARSIAPDAHLVGIEARAVDKNGNAHLRQAGDAVGYWFETNQTPGCWLVVAVTRERVHTLKECGRVPAKAAPGLI